MFYLSQLGGHKKVCPFRKVLCPGSVYDCELEMPFNKIEEHVKDCPDINEDDRSNDTASIEATVVANEDFAGWGG